MKISERTISALGRIVTGNSGISPYNSGPQLVRFFNELGANDAYGQGFPSRWVYAEEKIRDLNGTTRLVEVFNSVLDPRNFLETKFSLESVVEYLNGYLKYDGYELVRHGETYRVREIHGALVELEVPSQETGEIGYVFIDEQIKKCDLKIFEGDYDGAITNARSLLEAVLVGVEEKVSGETVPYDGDLLKLYRRVQRLLKLDPGRKDISDTLRQVLSGLTSVVSGLAGLRNIMSDAHASTSRPSKHHAKLAVNASKTVADFVLEVLMRQTNSENITEETATESGVG